MYCDEAVSSSTPSQLREPSVSCKGPRELGLTDWTELIDTLMPALILAQGISAQRRRVCVMYVCSCTSAFFFYDCVRACVCKRICVCEWHCGPSNQGTLMSQGRPGMKVETVMTPEGCRRQTSKNSRDSSAFIAYLPTPLFSLRFFCFIRETV